MGTNQFKKEEIVIAQSGNSGGTTAAATGNFSGTTILEMVMLVLGVMIIGYFCYERCKANWEKKIRREIGRSQQLV